MMGTKAKADLRLLKLANSKGKFALEMGLPMDRHLLDAFERGIDQQWFTLVDVAPLASAGMSTCRVFRLTDEGWKRLNGLHSLADEAEA